MYLASPTEMAWSWTTPYPRFPSAGFTGQLLVLTMLVIFSGAHEKVKRAHYETFWYTHHFFILWFGLLLMHGPYWGWWALFTLVPYAFDRIVLRICYRGNQRMALARVYFWGKPGKPDVITLQFNNALSDKGAKPLRLPPHMRGQSRRPALALASPALRRSWRCSAVRPNAHDLRPLRRSARRAAHHPRSPRPVRTLSGTGTWKGTTCICSAPRLKASGGAGCTSGTHLPSPRRPMTPCSR